MESTQCGIGRTRWRRKFLQEGKFKYIPYHRLFRRTEFLEVEGYGRFEAYANRDSLKYQEVYGLETSKHCIEEQFDGLGLAERGKFLSSWNDRR